MENNSWSRFTSMGKKWLRNCFISLIYLWEPLLWSVSQTCSGADEGQGTSSSASVALRGVQWEASGWGLRTTSTEIDINDNLSMAWNSFWVDSNRKINLNLLWNWVCLLPSCLFKKNMQSPISPHAAETCWKPLFWWQFWALVWEHSSRKSLLRQCWRITTSTQSGSVSDSSLLSSLLSSYWVNLPTLL